MAATNTTSMGILVTRDPTPKVAVALGKLSRNIQDNNKATQTTPGVRGQLPFFPSKLQKGGKAK